MLGPGGQNPWREVLHQSRCPCGERVVECGPRRQCRAERRLSRARRGQHQLSRRRENGASPYTNISPGKALAMLIEGQPYR